MMITDAMRATYEGDGAVVVPDLLDATDLALVRQELDRLAALKLYRDSATAAGSSHEISFLDSYSPVMRALLFDARILDVGAALLDGPFALHWSACFKKQARTGLGTRWHADNGQLAHRAVYGGNQHPPTKGLGMWIAIDEVASDGSSFMFIPGSRSSEVEHLPDPNNVARLEAVMTPELKSRIVRPAVPPGSVVLFSYDILHATGDNRSEQDRRAVSFHFLTGDQFTPHLQRGARFPWLRGPLARAGRPEYGSDQEGIWSRLRAGERPFPLHGPAKLDDVLRLKTPARLKVHTNISSDDEALAHASVSLPIGAAPLEHAIGWREVELLRAIDDESSLEELMEALAEDDDSHDDDEATVIATRERLAAFVGVLRDFGVLA